MVSLELDLKRILSEGSNARSSEPKSRWYSNREIRSEFQSLNRLEFSRVHLSHRHTDQALVPHDLLKGQSAAPLRIGCVSPFSLLLPLRPHRA